MKISKKMLSIILAIMMIVTIVPITASAATSGTCGENLTWNFDESTGTLTISGIGDMYDYYGSMPWNSFLSNIINIVIEDGVTSIGAYAFRNCTSLASVTIGDSVTSIGNDAFSDCTSLTSVIIGDSVTTIGNYAFEYCTSLASVTIPDSVTSIGDCAFEDCTSLTSVIIPDSVTSLGELPFIRCSNLKSIFVDSNNQYFSSDENGVLFNKDKSTLVQFPAGNESYTIPDSVITIGYGAFAYCTNLTDVTISNSVTQIDYGAFFECTKLTDVYYSCTEKQWNEIVIDNSRVEGVESGNAPLNNATKHFSGHSYDWYTISVATCETDGLMIGECSVCEDIDVKATPMTGHNMVDGVCTNCAEGTTGGNSKPTCTIHNYEWETVVEVSCTQNGVCVGTCTVCEDIAVDYHDAKGHEYVVTVTAPTCTAKGYTTYTCDCGDSYKDSFVDVIGHNYTSVVTAPTCTKQGYTTYTCACGDSYTDDVVDALGHTTAVSENILVAPTCTEKGSKEVVVTCTICNKEMNRETFVVDAKGHNLVNGDCTNCDYTENTGNEDNNDDNEDVTDPSENCSCNCHKSGISNFFFKIGLFFQKIFGSNKTCSCGVAHY